MSTEEQELQTEEQTEETGEQEDSYSKDKFEKLRNNMGSQIGELKNKLKEYESKQAEIDAVKASEDEKRAIEKGEFETVINNYKSQLESKDNELRDFQLKIETQKVDSALYREGIKDEFARLGVMTKYNSLDEKPSIDDFIAVLREQSPSLFSADKGRPARSSGSVGGPAASGTGNLLELSKSKDPKIARPAIRKMLELEMKGQPVS
jgi:hypothetical protein